jgi:hypothetical protein
MKTYTLKPITQNMDDRFAGLNLRKGFGTIKGVNMMQLTPWRRPHRRDITRFNREMEIKA